MTGNTLSILVVVVLYNQTIGQSRALNCLKSNTLPENINVKFFIYDNSSSEQTNGLLSEKYYYQHDQSNPGLSKAYNTACEYAIKNKFEWIILLDQDTWLPDNFYTEYIQAIRDNNDIKIFSSLVEIGSSGIYLSPAKYGLKKINPSEKKYIGRRSLFDIGIINSGMCINTNAFKEIGGYHNDVYLDFSDFYFIEKLREKYPIVGIIDIVLKQDFSGLETNKHKQLTRFRNYCKCAKAYPKESLKDYIEFLILVGGRAILLCFRFSTLKFLKIFMNNYLLK